METPLKFKRNRADRGITLVETLLVVAVGALIIVGAVLLYNTVFGDARSNDAMRQVQAAVSNVRSLYAGSPDFGTDDFTEVAVQAGVFPNAELVSGVPTNPWGGTLRLEGNGSSFTITYPDVPRKACVKLIRMNNTGLGGAALGVSVNDTEAEDLNITANDAVALCTDENTNEIVWEIR